MITDSNVNKTKKQTVFCLNVKYICFLLSSQLIIRLYLLITNSTENIDDKIEKINDYFNVNIHV